jgi:hypothetical protein
MANGGVRFAAPFRQVIPSVRVLVLKTPFHSHRKVLTIDMRFCPVAHDCLPILVTRPLCDSRFERQDAKIAKAVGSITIDKGASDVARVLADKSALVAPSDEDLGTISSVFGDMMREAQGEVVVSVGVGTPTAQSPAGLSQPDYDASVATLEKVAVSLSAHVSLLRERTESGGKAADFLLRSDVAEDDFMDVRIAVVGNVDAGKSTLLGVLSHGELDDGLSMF